MRGEQGAPGEVGARDAGHPGAQPHQHPARALLVRIRNKFDSNIVKLRSVLFDLGEQP